MSALSLSIGVSDCDRMRPLADGTVSIPGVDARWNLMGVQALFNKQLADHPFDACEFPLATYLRDLDGARRYLALPVFPSRHFRLSCVFINKDKGIAKPADLAGRRVGVMVWDMAAAVWLRGIFQDHYGLPRTAPIYVTNGAEAARTGDEHPQYYPPQFTIEHSNAPGGLSAMLERGEIDAVYTARAPSTWHPDGSGTVTRLFDSPQTEEVALYRKTGIYPPMHVFCIKRAIAEANPGLTKTLFAALVQSQKEGRARLFESAALNNMLPWQLEHLLETERLLGPNYWPAGFADNKAMLQTFLRYMQEEALVKGDYQPEDLFDADMLAT